MDERSVKFGEKFSSSLSNLEDLSEGKKHTPIAGVLYWLAVRFDPIILTSTALTLLVSLHATIWNILQPFVLNRIVGGGVMTEVEH